MPNSSFYSLLARSITSGEAALEPIMARASRTLGRNWRWLRALSRRYLNAFGPETRPSSRNVVAFLRADAGLKAALDRHGNLIRIAEWVHARATMNPVPVAKNWKIPVIESAGALAEWFQVSPAELEWFADLKRLATKVGQEKLEGASGHYRYRILAKEGGTIRLIEAPKRRLKELQRRILAEILENIPVHPAVHGFRKGRSIKTFAAPHVGQRVVVRMDLHDFFPSVSGARVRAMFRMAGYPEPVANLLTGLCIHGAPRSLWKAPGASLDPTKMSEARTLYALPHLPQGAPSSPALANVCAYRVDCRLRGLAESAGAVYTRYADDLAFSGGRDFARVAERFTIRAAAILLEEGFKVHHRKTRIMRQGVRQYLAGLVTNERINVVREDFDRLKATLTNCVRHGAESQNFEGHRAYRLHLEGRVGFVETVNPAKGARLRRVFERIQW
jgi:RNA-directed DNA polymerase